MGERRVETLNPQARRAIWGAFAGFFVDGFDIYLPVFGFSLAIVLPSMYAFYQTALANFMPFEYTILPILALGGLLTLVGAALGPETKDVDFFDGSSASSHGISAARAEPVPERSESRGGGAAGLSN